MLRCRNDKSATHRLAVRPKSRLQVVDERAARPWENCKRGPSGTLGVAESVCEGHRDARVSIGCVSATEGGGLGDAASDDDRRECARRHRFEPYVVGRGR